MNNHQSLSIRKYLTVVYTESTWVWIQKLNLASRYYFKLSTHDFEFVVSIVTDLLRILLCVMPRRVCVVVSVEREVGKV